MRMKSIVSRRDFFKKGIAASSALCFSSIEACSGNSDNISKNNVPGKARVVLGRSELVRNSDLSLNATSVYNLLNNAMENYYEIYPASRIWAGIFSTDDTVGLKINCLAGKGISTSIELVEAIIENLLSTGIKKGNIIVWDRANKDLEKAGYRIQTGSRDVKYYGNDYAGFTNRLYESRSVGSFLSNILVRHCTAIINVPILKDHGIVGITNALKNYFGAIHNPNKYHLNAGDPYIADLNLLPEIKNKTRLTICDVLTSQYEGGPPFMPQWTWHENGIMISTDMVAMDTIGWQLIENKRKEKGLPELKLCRREPTYISTAADKDHELGINKLDKIEYIKV